MNNYAIPGNPGEDIKKRGLAAISCHKPPFCALRLVPLDVFIVNQNWFEKMLCFHAQCLKDLFSHSISV